MGIDVFGRGTYGGGQWTVCAKFYILGCNFFRYPLEILRNCQNHNLSCQLVLYVPKKTYLTLKINPCCGLGSSRWGIVVFM